MSPLTPTDYLRYHRHLILPHFGQAAQERLKESSVLLIGAGGLGSPVSLYLAAAGVGRMGILDHDVVDESNLQRQILHGTSGVGEPKVESARRRLLDLNPHIQLELMQERLTPENALRLFRNYDLVVDGSDNFPTRYLANDAAVLTGIPLVYGSIYRYEGQVSVFHYGDGPCYRCLYSDPPPPAVVPSCAEGGVLGVLPGVIGSLQANEAIKVLTGTGEVASGRLILYDAFKLTFRQLKIRRDPGCKVCGDSPTIRSLIDYDEFCGVIPAADFTVPSITPLELRSLLQSDQPPRLLDMRADAERAIPAFPGHPTLDENEFRRDRETLSREEHYVVFCREGVRSARMVKEMQESGFTRVENLQGGISSWWRAFGDELSTPE